VNKLQMFSLTLAAVLAGPVHAQGCSGGSDGGMDATGNQCNTLNDVAAFATGSAIAPPAQIGSQGSVQASASAKQPAVRSAQMSGQRPTLIAIAVPASGKVRAEPSLPSKAAKTEIASEAYCSGGTNGGMDVNGDECGEASAAEGLSLVAQHDER